MQINLFCTLQVILNILNTILVVQEKATTPIVKAGGGSQRRLTTPEIECNHLHCPWFSPDWCGLRSYVRVDWTHIHRSEVQGWVDQTWGLNLVQTWKTYWFLCSMGAYYHWCHISHKAQTLPAHQILTLIALTHHHFNTGPTVQGWRHRQRRTAGTTGVAAFFLSILFFWCKLVAKGKGLPSPRVFNMNRKAQPPDPPLFIPLYVNTGGGVTLSTHPSTSLVLPFVQWEPSLSFWQKKCGPLLLPHPLSFQHKKGGKFFLPPRKCKWRGFLATNGRICPLHVFSTQTGRLWTPPLPQVFQHEWEELDLSVPFQCKWEGSIGYHNNKRAGVLGMFAITFNFIISTNTPCALPSPTCVSSKTDPSCTSPMHILSNSVPHHPPLLEMQDGCLMFQATVPTTSPTIASITPQQRQGCCLNFFKFCVFCL